ncbi:MAG: MDR family oxidoreductase [Steroidobacteraceae bacterium]
MIPASFPAIVARQLDGRTRGELVTIGPGDLPSEPVLVKVDYSTLNYKDGLAVSGRGKICRTTPLICGIDLAGTVVESADRSFAAGDRVLVNGFGLSEKYPGGYSAYQRLKSEWLVRIPQAFTAEQAMAIGTAGYTAMLCVLAIQDLGLRPGDGTVLVTGASGGVGSVAIMLLARLGYHVTAASGRASANRDFLTGLGASDLIDRSELARAARPLESERWSGVVDSVGSDTLATALAQTRYEGVVAACGLAGGAELPTSVMPFILRGVTLRGIDSVMASLSRRQRAWQALADLVPLDKLGTLYEIRPMSRLPDLAHQILDGRIRGRVVIDVNR